jgi:hypothetical protein
MERKQTHLMYGFLTGIAVVIVGLALHLADLSMKNWAQYVMYIPFLIGLILNAHAYAKANDHFVTYGNIWGSCFKASAIITLVVLVWSFISTFLFPEMHEKAMEMAREGMEERNMDEEQIEQAMNMTKKFFIPFMIAGVVFMYMIAGAIFSAIAAIFPKKKGEGMPPQVLQ